MRRDPTSLSNILPPRAGDIWRELKTLRKEIDKLRTARSLNAAKVSAGGQLTVAGTLAVDGNITLPAGSIPNQALASPVYPVAAYQIGSGYALATATGAGGGGPVRATCSITVPPGYTQALITATANDYGYNTGAGVDYLNAYLIINDLANSAAWAPSSTAPVNTGAAATVTATALLSGLTSGGQLTIKSKPFSTYGAWPASSSNSTTVSAVVMFLR
jgi:hypothetical protein